jgi:LexA-binding, inner membrane-associated putative hydrolase
MFIGHFALGLAAKPQTPRVSLAMLFVAAQFADLLWPVLLAVGVEQVRIDPGNTAFTPLDFVSYPYSHSLLALVIWGLLLAWGYRLMAGNGPRAFLVISSLVVSHWVLDVLTHRPDMPLYPNGPKFGLGLWNSIPLTMAIEVAMFGIGVWLYLRATRARDQTGRWGFFTLMAFLLLVYIGNTFGPPPPSVPAIYWLAMIGGVVLMLWAWWADQHRESIAED